MKKIVPSAKKSSDVVLWAIDPFERETRPDRTLVRKLMNWARSSGFEIQPVHVLTVPQNSSEEYLQGTGLRGYLLAAEKVAESYLRDIGAVGLRPAEVLITGSQSRSEEVEELLDYAEEINADCIVVSSHGRSGLQRLILGSFAENLLLHSPRPVMFLTHMKDSHDQDKQMTRALFATDFSDHSREAFLCFLKEARRAHLDLTIFHSVSLPMSALVTGYGAPMVLPQDYFPNQLKWAQQEAARWSKLAESYGVHTRLIVEDQGMGANVPQTILDIAETEGAGMIVMASVSGAVTSFVLGSVAREVFRTNRFPVWMYGPKALAKKPQHPHASQTATA